MSFHHLTTLWQHLFAMALRSAFCSNQTLSKRIQKWTMWTLWAHMDSLFISRRLLSVTRLLRLPGERGEKNTYSWYWGRHPQSPWSGLTLDCYYLLLDSKLILVRKFGDTVQPLNTVEIRRGWRFKAFLLRLTENNFSRWSKQGRLLVYVCLFATRRTPTTP